MTESRHTPAPVGGSGSVPTLHQATGYPAAPGHPAAAGAPSSARRDLFDLEGWSSTRLTALLDHAEQLATAAPPDALQGRSVLTLFYENSTRTRVSFEMAAQRLGARTITMTAAGSSVEKGESLLDTITTLDAMHPDVIVMRHSHSGAPEAAARWANAAIINAGDGWHAHPTQALLDAYTLRAALGDLRGKRIVIIGDILHSRVARSNCWSLPTLGAEVVLCGPPTMVSAKFATAYPHGVRVEHDLDRALAGADAAYALRIQMERAAGSAIPSLREYRARYGLTTARLDALINAHIVRPDLAVLHPGPMNEGIEIDPEVAHGPQSLVARQVANGVPVRMAVLRWALGQFDLPEDLPIEAHASSSASRTAHRPLPEEEYV